MRLRSVLTAAVYLAVVPLVGRTGAWGTPLQALPFGSVEAPGLTEAPAQAPSAPASASPVSIVSSRLEHRDVAPGALATVVGEIARGVSEAIWIAYTVPAIARHEGHHGWEKRIERAVLDEDGRLQPGNGTWGDTTILAILALMKGGTVSNVVTTDARVTIDAGRQRVVMLDHVRPKDSVTWLAQVVRDQARAEASSRSVERCAQGALAGIALTDDDSADTVLPPFTAAGQPTWLRRDAAFWLGAARGAAGAVVIDRLARSDADADFRQHLTFVLTLTGPTGVDTLIDLARHDASAQVRGQALFWLGQKAGQRAIGTLAGALDNDPDSQVRRQAVFAISQLPKDDGIPKLIELARTHRDPGVRQQAMFWLGQSGDSRALTFFEEVLSH